MIRLPAGNSITLEIEQPGNGIYYDMWCEQSEKIALWASGHRTKGIAELTQEEKGRVLEGLREKMKKAASYIISGANDGTKLLSDANLYERMSIVEKMKKREILNESPASHSCRRGRI